MARILMVGGGCRGRALAGELAGAGHAVRITTRDERQRAQIEAAGAECWAGTPDRIGTLRNALAGVTIACWLLGTAAGEPAAVRALHGSRLDFMLIQLIDTTVRGFVYEAAGTVPAAVLADGLTRVQRAGARHAIPIAVIDRDPADRAGWLVGARAALATLMGDTPPAMLALDSP